MSGDVGRFKARVGTTTEPVANGVPGRGGRGVYGAEGAGVCKGGAKGGCVRTGGV